MAAKTQKPSPEPPDWWDDSLYKFLQDPKFPLKGWVWEFMRRYRLKKLYKVEPVEAMRPNVQPGDVPGALLLYYWPWPEFDSFPNGPFYRPPASTIKGGKKWYWEEPIHIDWYEKEDWSLEPDVCPENELAETKEYKEILIDLNRRDEIIVDDVTRLVKQLRERRDKSDQMRARVEDWKGNYWLEVWDLREFNISWSKIQDKLGLGDQHSPVNAYRGAQEYIDRAKWKRLALHCEGLKKKPRS